MTTTLAFLFGSKTRLALLESLFAYPDRVWTLTQLAVECDADAAAVHRALGNLAKSGLVVVHGEAARRSFQLDAQNPYHDSLHALLHVRPSRRPLFALEELSVDYPMLTTTYLNVEKINEVLAENAIRSRMSRTLNAYRSGGGVLCFDARDLRAISKDVFDKLLADPAWGLGDTEKIIRLSDNLSDVADQIREKDHADLSDPELADCFDRYFSAYQGCHTRGWIQNAVDMPDMLLSNHLLSLLRKKGKNAKGNAADAFSKLTTPRRKSGMQLEYDHLLSLLILAQTEPATLTALSKLEPRHAREKIRGTKFGRALDAHVKRFGWLGYGYAGPNWDADYFVSRMSSLLRQGVDAACALQQEKDRHSGLLWEQDRLNGFFGLDEKERKLFEAAQGFVFAKGYRKDAMFKYLSCIEPFYAEICRRRFVSLSDIRFCYPHEMRSLILGKLDVSLLTRRRKFALCESTGTYGTDLHLDGEPAKAYFERQVFEEVPVGDVRVLAGVCACPGVARGKVKIVNQASDLGEMEKGGILVSIATMPDLLPAMKVAGASVTDMGGLTCHAAIVSRELNVPCVVGTKNATKAFQDGMLVEVDATHGLVKVVGR